MDVLCRKLSSLRLCLGTIFVGVVFCFTFISFLHPWTPHPLRRKVPMRGNDLFNDNQFAEEMDQQWKAEYDARVRRVRGICDKNELVAKRRIWRVATNRLFGKETFCDDKMCPIIVDEKKVLFYCFIPKVAMTEIKRFFLNISDIHINELAQENDTALHIVANNALRRISPTYYPSTTVNRFFKMIFVRHPFDRLVSAFRSKAEKSRKDVPYFYDRFWDPVMKKLRPDGAPLDRITFTEFVWYLIHTKVRDYDEHWAPYWYRCDPCLVDYDFIGKLETAQHDFPYAFRQVGIDAGAEWWKESYPHPHSLTLKYFSNIPEKDILKLYGIYKFDFELFDYTIEEFLHKKVSYNA
ncbi:carbohydrate sulfotransferase 11-like isoform X1 [Parasteatoda tepidariorum]|uniref:carbohydrate sulfotransferase 11-like isoform X1 n=2 Tax=Parasteatoda tepidariorum TaxID=114398 RepID=UPI00077FC285|nr:carbohydrate sulfotransferase 11-like [Parasteatoda tepidariorum]